MAGSSQLALWIIIQHRVQKTRVISPKTKFINNKVVCRPLQELLESNNRVWPNWLVKYCKLGAWTYSAPTGDRIRI